METMKHLNNESGSALGIVLIVLVVFSIMLPLVVDNTLLDMNRAVEFRDQKQAFYAVERAIEYAASRDVLLGMGVSENLVSDTDAGGVAHKIHIDSGNSLATGGGVLSSGTIVNSGPGLLPTRLAAAYGTNFGANYYDISATASGPGNSSASIETQIVRLYSKDDESVFITTGAN
jgi:type II secretory pathway pseudopilin PulG